MASLFSEFTETYERFRKQFPKHPLTEELRSRILRGRYPSSQWLIEHTKRMKELMNPLWRTPNPPRDN
ncbi:MAG: hypothetical protein AB1733_22635 [Thermodesulfobacteriota bacterium]